MGIDVVKLRRFALAIPLFAASCGDDSHPAADAPSSTADAQSQPDAPVATLCPELPNSQASYSCGEDCGHSLPFAALGNVDTGGEGSCGGPPEAVAIVLSADPTRSDLTLLARFQLRLPVAIGSQQITVYDGNGQFPVAATLEVLQVTLDGGGPGLDEVRATLSSNGGAYSGSFTAIQCAALTTSCI